MRLSRPDEGPLAEYISIHAPLTGCDLYKSYFHSVHPYFNPRTPYGMRQVYINGMRLDNTISIHAPLTGCDLTAFCSNFASLISIHAPLTGCDTSAYIIDSIETIISIHAPLTGCDPVQITQCLEYP